MLARLFSYPDDSLLIFGTYNPWLVALSIVIAIFTSAMALHMASQARLSKASRNITLFTGSVAQGGGVWAMHFIGMLAFDLCTPVEYDWWLTGISMAPSVAASVIALNLNSMQSINARELWVGGVLMGAGIGSMHYIGMAGMEMAPALRYDPWIFALSIVVAVLLSVLALWIRTGIRRIQALSGSPMLADLSGGIVMGIAISAMHYVGMAAARFVPPEGFELTPEDSNISIFLALGVAFATVMITCLVMAVDLVLRYKRMSHKAQRNEERIRGILQTAVDSIIIINDRGKILELNRAVESLLGWSRRELLQQNIKMLMPEPISSQHDSYLEQYMRTRLAKIIGQGRQVEAKHKNGETIPVRLAIGHVQFANEDLFVGFLTDLREQTQMQNELQENEARYRSLIGNIPGAAYRCNCNEKWDMIFVSDAVETITGYPASDFMAPTQKLYFADLIFKEDHISADDLVQNPRTFQTEYRITHRDGTIRWIQDSGECVTDEEGNVLWVDGFLMEITQRKQLDMELVSAKTHAEQAVLTRAAFLANMSHEIRTPMNAIIGFADILKSTQLNKEQMGYLKTLNNSAVSLLHLLNDILDISKLEKGKVELETIDFSLHELVDSVASTLWVQAKNKGLQLNVNISPNLNEYYKGSPDRIRQVLNNIVGNAIKFTEQGSVTLQVAVRDTGKIGFSVTDTGIGISEEALKSIFEPFTQADSSMNRRFGGTGLGTSISKQLVELMGGNLQVQSSEGKGSCFHFELPLPTGNPVEKRHQQYKIELPALNILAADDVQQNLDLLKIQLTNAGHKVTCVSDGEQAVRKAKYHQYDIILMDIQMPRMDGLTASKTILEYRIENQIPPIPIIAMTASVMESDRRAALGSGMSGFCSKPVEFNRLYEEIASVLDIPYVRRTQSLESAPQQQKLFDVNKGEALWGDRTTYLTELHKCVDRIEEETPRLHQTLERGDFEEVANAAHRWKGVCGNLSMTTLPPIFGQLESAANEKLFDRCCNCLHSIATIIKEFRPELEPLHTDTAHQEEPKLYCDIQQITESVTILIQAAERNACDDDALKRILEQSDCVDQTLLMKLEESFNNFEFSVALETLKTIQSTIQEPSAP